MRDSERIGAASVTWETERPWQHSAMQIAITGQGFAGSDLSLWQGTSSAAAEAESIAMSDDIACASATAIKPAAEAARGAHAKLPINRMASARMKAWRNVMSP